MTIRAQVAGVGHYLPERIVPNAEFEKTLDTTDEWIVSRSGIERRHFAAEGQATSELAAHAASSCCRFISDSANLYSAACAAMADRCASTRSRIFFSRNSADSSSLRKNLTV